MGSLVLVNSLLIIKDKSDKPACPQSHYRDVRVEIMLHEDFGRDEKAKVYKYY